MNLNILRGVLAQFRDPNKKTWILLSPSSLGETLSLCSLSESFIKKHGYSITLVIPRGHEFIVKCYPNLFHKIFFMSVEDMRLFCSSNIVPKNFFELDFPINTWSNQVNDTNPISLYELYIASKGKKGLNYSDLYRFNLRLDWDSPVRLPSLPRQECNLIFNNLQAVHNFKKEYVLLMYGNNTNKQIPAPYLNHLCRGYEKLGIEVVANANGATFKSKIDNVSNIKFLDLTVPETVSLAMNSQAVIGGSNGCMALLESLELFKKFHVFLPNFALEDPEKLLFRKVSPFEGSNASLWPEMISLSNNLFEYSVEENPSEAQIKEVVNAIING